MPQIIKIALALACLVVLGGLGGCGDENSRSTYDPEQGNHPSGWLPSGHAGPARAHLDSCRDCHGQDFSGGIAKVACTQCHLGGPLDIHPVAWSTPGPHGPLGYALHASFVQQNGAASCANAFCHGTDLAGVPGSGPSCSSCHMGGPFSVHPPEWNNQITLHGGYVLQNGTAACRNAVCHGPQLEGVFLSGPGCNACHSFATPIADIPAPLGAAARQKARQALAEKKGE